MQKDGGVGEEISRQGAISAVDNDVKGSQEFYSIMLVDGFGLGKNLDVWVQAGTRSVSDWASPGAVEVKDARSTSFSRRLSLIPAY